LDVWEKKLDPAARTDRRKGRNMLSGKKEKKKTFDRRKQLKRKLVDSRCGRKQGKKGKSVHDRLQWIKKNLRVLERGKERTPLSRRKERDEKKKKNRQPEGSLVEGDEKKT